MTILVSPRAWWRGAVAVLLVGLLGIGAWAAQPPVNTDQLRSLLDKEGASVFLLDVRTPGEWAEGHIAGSVLIPMSEIPGRLAEIPKDKKIVAVCASGARSAAVARFLDQRGYPWVANYGGGIYEWRRRSLPLER